MRSCRWAIEEERLHELCVPVTRGMPAHVELSVTVDGGFCDLYDLYEERIAFYLEICRVKIGMASSSPPRKS
jgi:hypothetical protein